MRNHRGQLTLYNAAFIVILALMVGAFMPTMASMITLVTGDVNVSNNTKTVYGLLPVFFALGLIALPIIYSKIGSTNQ